MNKEGNYFGPQRVYLPGMNVPGLSMTRSFGDKLAHSVGVIDKPRNYNSFLYYLEIKEFDTKNIRSIILGSDGLWEHLHPTYIMNSLK